MSLQDPNLVNPDEKKRVAIVVANPTTSTTTGWPVGFWWSELTHSYYLLTEPGYEVEVFSPDGGACQADALSDPRDQSGYSASDTRHAVADRRRDETHWRKLRTRGTVAAVRDSRRQSDHGQQNFSGPATAHQLIEALGR